MDLVVLVNRRYGGGSVWVGLARFQFPAGANGEST